MAGTCSNINIQQRGNQRREFAKLQNWQAAMKKWLAFIGKS
jgi:hypothetical protein